MLCSLIRVLSVYCLCLLNTGNSVVVVDPKKATTSITKPVATNTGTVSNTIMVDAAADSSPSSSGGLRMIEFFSGIGGMRLAVEAALRDQVDENDSSSSSSSRSKMFLASCRAYDISLNANRTYTHNFKGDQASTKLVEQLKVSDLDGKADLWTMSPPCQPFTKTQGAKGLDMDDKRCHGLKNGVMRILSEMVQKPRWILLENVKGFSTSRMCEAWKECLEQNGYSYQEYLLSPIQIGIPNHRLRYYILCERLDDSSTTRWPSSLDQDGEKKKAQHPPSAIIQQPPAHWRTIVSSSSSSSTPKVVGDYLQDDDSSFQEELQPYLVSDAILSKGWAAQHLGIVGTEDTATHCFTAGYSRMLSKATGSLLLFRDRDRAQETITPPPSDTDEKEEMETMKIATTTTTTTTTKYRISVADHPIDRSDMLQYSGRLRRFTPNELLALFGFPKSFSFPSSSSSSPSPSSSDEDIVVSSSISLENQYKLIGNSINVSVVTLLMKELLHLFPSSPPVTATTTTTTATATTTTDDDDSSRRPTRGIQQVASSSVADKNVPPAQKLTIGEGIQGHVPEEIEGYLLRLYQAFRWKPLPNCTGRYTCRDHNVVSFLPPLELLAQVLLLIGEKNGGSSINAGAPASSFSSSIPFVVYSFDLPGREDRVLVVPLDPNNRTGLISFEKRRKESNKKNDDDDDNNEENTTTSTTTTTSYVHTLNSSSGFRRKLNAIGINHVTDSTIQVQRVPV